MGTFRYFLASAMLFVVAMSSETSINPDIFDPVADPTCSRGVQNGDACCPKTCEECGGRGCSDRQGGAACCKNAVIALERSCAGVGAPCDVSLPTSAPTTTSTAMDSKTTAVAPTGMTTTGATSAPTTRPVINIWKNISSKIKGTMSPRHDACFVMLRGKGYLLGGRGLPVTNMFNPKTRTWTAGAAPPFEFHHAQCVVFKNKVFVPASYSGDFPMEEANAKMLVYDARNDRWTTRPGLPVERRRGSAASVLYDSKLWVIGGSQSGHGGKSKTVGFMDFYDLVTKKWVTELPNLPIKRDHFGGAIVKGLLCVAGGRDSSKEDFFSAVVRSTWCYNFSKMEWKNVRAPLPGARAGAAYGKTCDGKLIVAGGEGKRMRPFIRVDLFDGEKWTRGPSLQRGRHSTGLAVAGCKKCSQIFITAGNGKQGDVDRLMSTEVFLPGAIDEICEKY